jgi:hypothetical protein
MRLLTLEYGADIVYSEEIIAKKFAKCLRTVDGTCPAALRARVWLGVLTEPHTQRRASGWSSYCPIIRRRTSSSPHVPLIAQPVTLPSAALKVHRGYFLSHLLVRSVSNGHE